MTSLLNSTVVDHPNWETKHRFDLCKEHDKIFCRFTQNNYQKETFIREFNRMNIKYLHKITCIAFCSAGIEWSNTQRSTSVHYPWRKSTYLQERTRQLQPALRELDPHQPVSNISQYNSIIGNSCTSLSACASIAFIQYAYVFRAWNIFNLSSTTCQRLYITPTVDCKKNQVIDDHYACLTPQGIQHGFSQMVTHQVINLVQQGLNLVNRRESVALLMQTVFPNCLFALRSFFTKQCILLLWSFQNVNLE